MVSATQCKVTIATPSYPLVPTMQLALQVGVFVPTLNLLGSQVFTESRSSSLEIQLLLLLHLLLLLLHLLLLLLHLLLLLLVSQVFPESEERLRGYDQV